MSSGCKSATVLAAILVWCGLAPVWAAELRVCADPNNLPFSNQREQGFENELARLVARDLGRDVRYVWSRQRSGFLRKTLRAGTCDIVMGVPAGIERVATTRPYYGSSYVFVYRRDRGPAVHSFNEPSLRTAHIGVHIIGDDQNTVPPAQALIDRGMLRNIAWYKLYPNFTRENPPSALIDAVANGEIDVAVAWGPMAGYFARRSTTPLGVAPVSPATNRGLPMAFDISMAVRREDTRLLQELNSIIERRRSEIRRILRRYGVPLNGEG